MLCAGILLSLVALCSAESQIWDGVSVLGYAAQVSQVITKKYEVILAEVEAFKPDLDKCAVNLNTSIDNCLTCLDSVSCGSSGGGGIDQKLIQIGIAIVSEVKDWPNEVEKGLTDVVNSIADGAETIFNKYGVGAIKGLQDGFSYIGKAFKQFGDWISNGFQAAFDKIGDAFNWLKNKFSDIFGRRKRSTDNVDVSNVQRQEIVREKRDIQVSSEEKACMSKCATCSPFVSGKSEAAAREVCGDTLVNKNASIAAALSVLEGFYTDWKNATQPLIRNVYLDTTSYMLTSMDLLKDNQYVTYNLASLGVDIKFQMLNNDATYLAMVNFAYSTY